MQVLINLRLAIKYFIVEGRLYPLPCPLCDQQLYRPRGKPLRYKKERRKHLQKNENLSHFPWATVRLPNVLLMLSKGKCLHEQIYGMLDLRKTSFHVLNPFTIQMAFLSILQMNIKT